MFQHMSINAFWNMKFSRCGFRAMILCDFKQCHESLTRIFKESALFQATVGNWYLEFKTGQKSLEDKPHLGWLHNAVTSKKQSDVGEIRYSCHLS